MIVEIKEILDGGDIKTIGDIKPIFMGFVDLTHRYCTYIRSSVYTKAKLVNELDYYKEKTNDLEASMRGYVNIFIRDMYNVDENKSVFSNIELDNLFYNMGELWQRTSLLAEEASYRFELNLLSFSNFHKELKRIDKLDNLLKYNS